MPEQAVQKRAQRDKAEGKAPTTQAGEFVKEEIEHVREGKHGARSTKQAIAIGLSKARRAGVDLRPPARGATSEETRRNAKRAYERGHGAPPRSAPSPRRKRATLAALKKEGSRAASPKALSRQATSAAARKTPAERSRSAREASRTKGPRGRKAAGAKAARTRASASQSRG